ncbi:DUF397 domain-containing protein [Actinomadura keratinilytica]|jgi:hypothetical protein|uniref:DUF397 domain-containing protein n=1 Tax=Actinomadura keratinilytica TaxID=547461 RepID=A0ABP7Y1G4_9ACTN
MHDISWPKTACSQGTGCEFVEVAPVSLSAGRWRKASRSTGSGEDCVEVARVRRGVAVRDSKDPSGPVLTFGCSEFVRFAEAVRLGTFDLEGGLECWK